MSVKGKGNLKKKRRQAKKPLSFHEFTRLVAWPIGESEELTIWMEIFKLTPVLMMLLGTFNLAYWALEMTPHVQLQQVGYWFPPVCSFVLCMPYTVFKLTGVQ